MPSAPLMPESSTSPAKICLAPPRSPLRPGPAPAPALRANVLADLCCPGAMDVRDELSAAVQGLTLVHHSAQRKRLQWDMWCIHGMLRGCLGGVRRYEGVFRVH